MNWEIDHETPEGLVRLGEVMKQFILWHKKDIVLNVCSPTPSDVHLEQAFEDGDAYSSAPDDHTSNMPHSSLAPSEHMTDPPQTSPARHTEQGHDEMPQCSPARLIEQGHEEMPQCSPAHHIEQGHDEMPHPCPTEQRPNDPLEPSQQARPIPKQGLPSEKEDAVAHQSMGRKKIPYHTRPIFTPMENVSLIDKWFTHD
jgi:hypothetical protein